MRTRQLRWTTTAALALVAGAAAAACNCDDSGDCPFYQLEFICCIENQCTLCVAPEPGDNNVYSGHYQSLLGVIQYMRGVLDDMQTVPAATTADPLTAIPGVRALFDPAR